MKIVFFGTGKFGLPALKKLFNTGHEISLVVTQPDKRSGRGWKVQPAPIKEYIYQNNHYIHVLQPENLNDGKFIEDLKKIKADIFVVIDYGKKLSNEILALPQKYAINLHPSLLPKYRGAAPINWALINGEKETGNTVIKITDKMDAGDIVLQKKFSILENENSEDLFKRLSDAGGDLVVKAVDMIEKGEEKLLKQNEDEASIARKLTKEDGLINWNEEDNKILNKIRGLLPWPGAYTNFDGKILKIKKAVLADVNIGENSSPGTVVDDRNFIVSTKSRPIRIEILQLAGKKEMTSKEFLTGQDNIKGKKLT